MEDLEKRGAEARAQGLELLDNPFYRSEALPVATGESAQAWGEKAAAWDRGWTAEHLMRAMGASRS